VKRKSKTYKLTCAVTVKTTQTVTNAKQLAAALKNNNITKILLKSTASTTFTIPQGTYSSKALVVDTPNAEVINRGVFKSITIRSIKRESYTEKAIGNKIKITAAAARVVVSEQASPASINVASAGANVVVVANGTVGSVAVNGKGAYVVLSVNNKIKGIAVNAANSTLAVVANSSIGDIAVNEYANILITGREDVVPVTVSKNGESAKLTSSVKLDIVKAVDSTVDRVTSGKVDSTEPDDSEDSVLPVEPATYCAKIGNTSYYSLQEAVNTASTSPITITLIDDIEEDVTIWTGNDITLDLNGHNITNTAIGNTNTIFLYLDAKLTIKGTGTIDNIADKKSAVYNNGTLILNGGTFDRSSANEGNSWYTICNYGRMTVGNGVTVCAAGGSLANSCYVALIQNGYENAGTDYKSNTSIRRPTLTIEGGTFRGGLYSIANDENGILTVNDGTFAGYSLKAVSNRSSESVLINGGTGIN
jgi:hypothetical protein